MALEAEELELPEFLENSDEDEIHKKMLANLPDDMDKTEGGFPWDFTRPTAIAISELMEDTLVEILKCLFPATCDESYILDLHAATRGLYRKEAEPATGNVQVTAEAGTVIPLNYGFTTEADEDGEVISFFSTAEVTVGEDGQAEVPVEAEEGGTQGNVAAGTIVLQSGDEDGDILENITGVTNASPTSGGIDEEEDDDLRERIVTYDQSQDWSYVGSNSDYRRWALSVSGVGSVAVIEPTDDSGIITLVIIGQDGLPASEEICTAVYDYIMSPDAPESRLAPIGAKLSVISPDGVEIGVNATVFLDGTTAAEVSDAFESELQQYLLSAAADDNVVRLFKAASLLLGVEGVYDIKDFAFTKDGTTVAENISLESGSVPVVGDIVLTEAT